MTTPRPRPAVREQANPDAMLERLLILTEQWRKGPLDDRRPIAEEVIDGFSALAEALSSGKASLPQQWAGVTPPTPELPGSGVDAEVAAAQAAMLEAEKALAAAEAAELQAHDAREAAARALGEARKTFYDLARVRDLSRP